MRVPLRASVPSSLRRWWRSAGRALSPHQGALANARRAIERDRRTAVERAWADLELSG